MNTPNYAPVYCALYPELANIARGFGYALAIHGSLARDMDLICVPWVEHPHEPHAVVDAIKDRFAIKQVGQPVEHMHGRIVYTLSIGFGECFIDMSFMARTYQEPT